MLNLKNYKNNKCKVFQKKETNEIKCCNNSCKKVLAHLLDQKNNDSTNVLYRLSIKCPFCNSKSYDFDVYGNLSWVMGDGVNFVGIQEDDKNCRVIWETSR